MIAALFVEKNGVYSNLPDIDVWDIERDARNYRGPWQVIAHPPCQRWGRYWSGGPKLANTPKRKKLGDDGGCFAFALEAVRLWGGVIEHPEASAAWETYGLLTPPRHGGWVNADSYGGWTCCVEQGHYGHQSRKATWLYLVGDPLPLKWGKSAATKKFEQSYHSKEERRKKQKMGIVSMLSKYERLATPVEFRDELIRLVQQ